MTTRDKSIKRYKKKKEKFELLAKVNRANMNKEMSRIAGNLFRVGSEKAKAEYLMNLAEIQLKIVKAKAYKKIKSGKKRTEAEINHLVNLKSDVIKARDKHADCIYYHSLCFSAVTSQTQKGQQLTNLGYNYRKELDQRSYVNEIDKDAMIKKKNDAYQKKKTKKKKRKVQDGKK